LQSRPLWLSEPRPPRSVQSQKRQQAAEQRAAEAHNLKKQEFELKKAPLASRKRGGAGGFAREEQKEHSGPPDETAKFPLYCKNPD